VAEQVADFVLKRLRQWGIEEVYAYPGDGINGLVAAFGRAGDQPRFIQTRHEEMAAFAATGYAKFSGRVGVCMATSGPGAIHLLNGLYDAKLDHVPVVAIVGQTARSAVGGAYQQEVDLKALFKDVASEYLVEVNVAAQLPNGLDRAIRTAVTRRAPTAVIIPSDVQEEPYDRATSSSTCPRRNPTTPRRCSPPTVPRSDAPPTSSTPARRWPFSSDKAPAPRRRRYSRSPTPPAPASPKRYWARMCYPTSCRM
jgi:pyruvate dehydrogenase (quinone)